MFGLYIIMLVWGISQIVGWLVIRPYYKLKYAREEESEASKAAAATIHLFATDKYYSSSPNNPFAHPAMHWEKGELSVIPGYEFNGNEAYKPALSGTIKLAKIAPNGEWLYMILDNRKLARLGLPRPSHPPGIISVISNTPNPVDGGWQN